MPDVFISYKRQERARVERLAAALASLKLDVWFDAALEPGTTFFSEIQDALNASRAVIVCWTPAATSSPYVLGEAEHGRRQNKLIATFFADCTLPSPFNMIHAEDLSRWHGDVADITPAWRKVLGGVSRLVMRPGLVEFTELARSNDPGRLRRWASDNWKDALAPAALDLARRWEAGEIEYPGGPAPSRDDSARPRRSAGPDSDNVLARLGPKAEAAAATNDRGEALVNLGRDYLEGYGAREDAEAARVLFELAAAKGAPAAYFNLGLIYMQGRGVAEDHVTARKYFDEAASRGVAAALTNLGIIYEQGQGAPRDYQKARSYYERAAAAGDDCALANIAVMHGAGRGVPQDWTEARRWFEKAAQKGNAGALDNLGTIYARGLGVAVNPDLARKCYEAAAEQGEVSALYNLGVYHLDGVAGARNPAAALSYFERAAALNHASATANLAAMFATGTGVSPDLDQAVRLFERAAELGAASALVNLGRIFSDPGSHLFDLREARRRFAAACDRGEEQGCFHLAMMLAAGEGGERDKPSAERVLKRLARQNNDPVAQAMAVEALSRGI